MSKPLKDTRLGHWLKDKAPKVLETVGDVLPDKGVLGIVKNLIHQDPEVSPEVKAEFDKLAAEHEKEMYSLEIDDRKNARAMYTANSDLQKFFAMTFLFAYVAMTIALLTLIYVIAYQKIQVPEWAIGSISAIWGGMSTKVGTITDFLFGSSFRHKEPETVGIRGK